MVDMSPLIYLLVLHGFVYFLPFGIFKSWSIGEDGLAEWIRLFAYAAACACSLSVIWLRRRQLFTLQGMAWIILALFLFYASAEEINWGERIHGWGVEFLRDINAQKETNVHNLPAVQNYLHFLFIAAGLFFGYAGWRWVPTIDALPPRKYSLYLLFVALFMPISTLAGSAMLSAYAMIKRLLSC